MSMSNSPFPLLSELPEVAEDQGDPKALAIYRLAHDEGFRHGEIAGQTAGYEAGLAQGREEGFRRGHSEGLVAGIDDAAAMAEAKVRRNIEALEIAIAALAQREATALEEIETNVVDLALSLAAAILDREVDASIDPGGEAIARALKLAPGRGELTIRMNPNDCEALGDLSQIAPGRDLLVVPDAAIEAGGALVETDTALVDARISTALARAREVLADPNHEAVNGFASVSEGWQ